MIFYPSNASSKNIYGQNLPSSLITDATNITTLLQSHIIWQFTICVNQYFGVIEFFNAFYSFDLV